MLFLSLLLSIQLVIQAKKGTPPIPAHLSMDKLNQVSQTARWWVCPVVGVSLWWVWPFGGRVL